MQLILCLFAIIGGFIAPSLQFPNNGPIENMTIVHVWKNLEYGFETTEEYQYAIDNGLYSDTGFKRPYDVDISYDKKKASVYLSTPRVTRFVPYTLSKVSNEMGQYGLKLMPYPNYAAHSPSTPLPDRIVSVFRIYVDPCQHLWAIDTGRDFFASPTQVSPPKILVYDLKTDELIFKYTIPEGQYVPNLSVHNSITVDIYDPKDNCQKGKAYLTDSRGNMVVVFDLETKASWAISNELFKPNPLYTSVTVAGETFTFTDGPYTITPDRKNNKIYLHAFAAVNELAASLSNVNDRSRWINNASANQDDWQVIGSRPTQSATQAIDSKGNVYFSLLNPLSILSWDTDKPYTTANFKTVVENEETLQVVVGLKIRKNRKGEEILIALSNRLQKLNTGTISLAEDNYRFMVCRRSTLQAGRGKCGGL